MAINIANTIEIELPSDSEEKQLIEIEIPAGTRGLQGPPGPKGRDGREFQAMIGNTVTLPPGQDATVTINEDEENDIIYYNFGIPKGEKGDKGDTGNVDMATFDVVDGKLIMRATRQREEIGDNYTFQLDDNKLEVVY